MNGHFFSLSLFLEENGCGLPFNFFVVWPEDYTFSLEGNAPATFTADATRLEFQYTTCMMRQYCVSRLVFHVLL
jgi:hypothetical protein